MAQEDVNIKINVGGNGLQTVKQMKDEIRQLTIAMGEAGARGDKAGFDKFAVKIGGLKNEIAQLNQGMKNVDPQQIVASVAGLASGIAGGFSAISAGFDLIAGDNKAMQETMGKTAKIIQMLQGLESVRQLFEKQGLINSLALQAKNLFMKQATTTAIVAQTVAIEGQAAATAEATVAQEAMNVAAYANPYVLLAIAIAALVVAIGTYASSASEAADQNEKTLEGLEKLSEAQTENTAIVELATAQTELELKVNRALGDAFEYVRVMLGGLTDEEIKHLKSMQDMGDKVKTLSKDRLDLAKAEGKSNLELLQIKKVNAQNEFIINSNLFKKNTELSNDQRKKLKEDALQAGKDYIQIEKDIAYEKIRIQKEADEEAKKKREEAGKDYEKAIKELNKKIAAGIELNNKELTLLDIKNTKDKREKHEKEVAEYIKTEKEKIKQELLLSEYTDSRVLKAIDEFNSGRLTKDSELFKLLTIHKAKYEAVVRDMNKNFMKEDDEFRRQMQTNWDDAMLSDIELSKKRIEEKYEVVKGSIEKLRLLEIEDIKNTYSDKIVTDQLIADADRKAAALQIEIVNKKNKEIAAIDDKYRQDGIDKEKKRLDDIFNLTATEMQKEITAITEAYDEYPQLAEDRDRKILEIRKKYADKEVQVQRDKVSRIIEEASREIDGLQEIMNNMMTITQNGYDEQTSKVTESYDKRIKAINDEGKVYTEKELRVMELERQKQVELDVINKKANADKKKQAEINIIIDTAQAVARAFKDYIWPYSLIPAGISAALGAAQLAVVEQQTYAQGGFLKGQSHANGGITATMEGGEAVINKKSMSIPALRNLASDINVMGGGVSFAVPSRGNGSSQTTTLGGGITYEEAVALINSQQVYVTEYDISKTQRKVKVTENRAKI